jgi:hypothetical protein
LASLIDCARARSPYYPATLRGLPASGAGGGSAPTAAGDELVLDDPHLEGWQIEHLATFHPHLGSVGEVRAAARARAGLVPLPLVRVGDQRQRRPRMARLPTRSTAAAAP